MLGNYASYFSHYCNPKPPNKQVGALKVYSGSQGEEIAVSIVGGMAVGVLGSCHIARAARKHHFYFLNPVADFSLWAGPAHVHGIASPLGDVL